jgi:uncharacterized membrane protein
VFIVGTIVATMAELIASYIIDAVIGIPLWDYNGYLMNFDGSGRYSQDFIDRSLK